MTTINQRRTFLLAIHYIEKESSVNDEIDKLRHSATSALLERRDVIVVASVSSMYGLVNPKITATMYCLFVKEWKSERDELLRRLGRNAVRA